MRKVKIIFIVLFAVAIAAPPLGLFGLRGVVRIAGVEPSICKPEFSVESWLGGRYLPALAKYYERQMFCRGEMLTIKNIFFELFNFGRYHAGYSGNIIQGKKGYLFEDAYLKAKYNPPTRYHTPEHTALRGATAKRLEEELAKRGIRFGFILVPNKADVCEGLVPDRYLKFSRNHNGFDVYASYESLFVEQNMTFVNGKTLCGLSNESGVMFPYSGTHWTVYAASLCVSDLLGKLNARHGLLLPVPKVVSTHFEKDIDDRSDHDLEVLLNLPWWYKTRHSLYIHTDFEKLEPSPKAVFILGDSFCGQLHSVLKKSAAFSKIYLYSNKLPRQDEQEKLEAALANSAVFIMAYSSASLGRDRVRQEMQYLLDMLAPTVR